MKPTGAALTAGVIGQPIAHSLSPLMMSHWIEAAGLNAIYAPFIASPHMFAPVVLALQRAGLKGLNVTLPFKTRAFELADEVSSRAQAAGAANFLMRDDGGRIVADNTDGKGLVSDMTAGAGWSLADARILLIGAGGAVKGVIPALLEAGPKIISIVNRTAERAEQLADEWRAIGAPVQGAGLESGASGEWDVVINGTSTGLSGGMPALPDSLNMAPGCRCYDMAYGDKPTPFMLWSTERGAAATRDGLGMLVEQAAESFYLWIGDYPDTRPVIDLLRGF